MTVSKAYGPLELEQVLERRPGRPLTVACHDDARGDDDRRALLRESLVAPARLARQLGLARAEALDLFVSLLTADWLAGDWKSRRRPTGPPRDEEGGGR